jgi:hypothetical protein
MSDLALLLAIMGGVSILTWAVVSWLCNAKIADIRAEHVQHTQEIHHDYMMPSRIYGAVPIERLIGYESAEDDDE